MSCVLAPSLYCHLTHRAWVLGVSGSRCVPVVGKIDGNSDVMSINSHACFHFLICLQSTKPKTDSKAVNLLSLSFCYPTSCCWNVNIVLTVTLVFIKSRFRGWQIIVRQIKGRKNDWCIWSCSGHTKCMILMSKTLLRHHIRSSRNFTSSDIIMRLIINCYPELILKAKCVSLLSPSP